MSNQNDLTKSEKNFANTNQMLQQALDAGQTTPSQAAARREEAVLLADAMERLPADYREVILLRNLEGLPFDELLLPTAVLACLGNRYDLLLMDVHMPRMDGISASRSIIYADMAGESAGRDFAAAARETADNLRRQINELR